MPSYIPYDEQKDVDFSSFLGEVITEIDGLKAESEVVTFKTASGRELVMFHDQDCCEGVSIESVVGDVGDLIGHLILIAEVATSEETPAGYTHDYEPDSQTWTFYKLATTKGYVDIRWLGESNGYYSESVDLVERIKPTAA